MTTGDPLGLAGYGDALRRARAATGADESVAAGRATIGGLEVELAAFRFGFLGGSMGEVAGERLARALERAARRGVPFVLSTATGGARLQEGMRALVQMPKLVSARLELAEARQPLLAALGTPTAGGVLATLGALADFTVAEEGALIGFAGPRVVQRFTRQPLAPGSHTAASALAHGLVDAVVAREAMGAHLAHALRVLRPDRPSSEVHAPPAPESGEELDAWEAVRRARDPQRLTGEQLIDAATDERVELHGDRAGAEDPGVHAAVGRVEGRRCMLVALDRDRPAGPAGCRKALRALELAARLGLPVVTFVDTAGLDPSEPSEAAGIAWAVGGLMQEMLSLPVPSLAIVSGEGGSGGALAFATADTLVAFSDATFSVIGPESAAEILWRDPGRAPEAARMLRLTAPELVRLGIADALVQGPPSAANLRALVAYHLARCTPGVSPSELVARRRRRWRGDG